MKSKDKRQQNSKPQGEPPVAELSAAGFTSDEIECLAKLQPSNILDALPKHVRPVYYEVLSGMGVIPFAPDDERPEWARCAWKEFWRAIPLAPRGKSDTDDETFGYRIGLVANLQAGASENGPFSGEILKMLLQVLPKIRDLAAKLPPTEAADFFSGQKRGTDRAPGLLQLSQRTKIFLVIALAWREVAKLKSAGELFHWLRSIGDNDTELIAAATDSREIRAVAKIIGIPYTSRGGRPPKKTRL